MLVLRSQRVQRLPKPRRLLLPRARLRVRRGALPRDERLRCARARGGHRSRCHDAMTEKHVAVISLTAESETANPTLS